MKSINHQRDNDVPNNKIKPSFKVISRIIIIVSSLIGIIILCLIGFYLGLNFFPNKITKLISDKTDYKLNFTSFHAGFNRWLQPDIKIKGLTINYRDNKDPIIQIQDIEAALSYQTLIKFKPIFSNIKISGTSIRIEYDNKDNLLLNGQTVSNLAKPSKSDFDAEGLLLLQHKVVLSDINLELIDYKHNYIKPISINKINLSMENIDTKHFVKTQFRIATKNKLELDGRWDAARLSKPETWSNAQIKVFSLTSKGYQIRLNTSIKDGSILRLITEFDSNQQVFANINNNMRNFTGLSGNLRIDKVSESQYSIVGKDITINTNHGYLFNNANLEGVYNNQIGGKISLDYLDMAGINSLLSLDPIGSKLNISGSASPKLSWVGAITKPKMIILNSSFDKITVKSSESNIPSLDNINAKVILTESQLNLTIAMHNNKLSYPKLFSSPIFIESFSANSTLEFESKTNLSVGWQNANLQTTDFIIRSSGNYLISKDYLDLKGQLVKLNLARLEHYLPRNLPPKAISTIRQSLLAGDISHGSFELKGKASQIPFKNESEGKLSFSADIDNLNYKFLPEWGKVNSINAKVRLDNKSINANISSGMIGKTKLTSARLTIANWSESKGTLYFNSLVNGSTKDFLGYLQESSPFEQQLKSISSRIEVTGNAKLNLSVNLPLNSPERLSLQGKFSPINNQINLTESQLTISNINGALNFTQAGLSNSKIDANTLDSKLELHVLNSRHLELNMPDLDYGKLFEMAYSPITKIIHGKAPTTVAVDLSDKHLQIKSNMFGVAIEGVSPLQKQESTIAPLKLDIYSNSKSTDIVMNYDQTLRAQAQLNQSGGIDYLHVAIGKTATYQLASPLDDALVTIRADFPTFDILAWSQMLSKLQPPAKVSVSTTDTKGNESVSTISKVTENELDNNTSKLKLFPIQVEINSNSFLLGAYNFNAGQANIIINPQDIGLNVATSNIKGNLNYQLAANQLDINLDKLLYSSSNLIEPKLESTSQFQNISESATSESTITRTNREEVATNNQQIPIESSLTSKSNSESPISVPIASIAKKSQNETSKSLQVPQTSLLINNLYYENHYLGKLKARIKPDGDTIYLESGSLTNRAATTTFSGSDNCIGCNDEALMLVINSKISDFGLLINKLDQGDIFKGGNGTFNAIIEADGSLSNFDAKRIRAHANLHVSKGELIHVNPGLFGSLLGVISLRSITSIDQFNMNNFFGKGFAFDNLDTQIFLNNQNLQIENFKLLGQIASITTFGNIYLDSNIIDTYLTVEPRLGGTVATTAGIVTLNPIVGVIVYLGQGIIGEPVNKALALSYHINGTVESPVLTQTKISKQLMENFNSSINIFDGNALPSNLLPNLNKN